MSRRAVTSSPEEVRRRVIRDGLLWVRLGE